MFDNIVGTLSRKYCFYFYVITIFSFIIFIGSLISIITVIYKGKYNYSLLFSLFALSFTQFLMYIQSRLFYSICESTLK